MPSSNTNNKTLLYSYYDADTHYTIFVYNDGSETISNQGSGPNLTDSVINLTNSKPNFNNTKNTIVLGNSAQRVNDSSAYNDVIFTNNAGDIIDGHLSSGNNAYFGNNAKEVLIGGTGNDYLDGAAGSDVVMAGSA